MIHRVLEAPSFIYPDTGIYIIKLVVNPGEPCSDSATMQIGLYPGFFPDFVSSGICVTKPTSFTDATTTAYGVVSGWRWDFGELTVSNDTSRLRNPVYSYPTVGVKNVNLIVQSSKGCIDTVTKEITIIDKPPITLPFRDTLICNIDTFNYRQQVREYLHGRRIIISSWQTQPTRLFTQKPRHGIRFYWMIMDV